MRLLIALMLITSAFANTTNNDYQKLTDKMEVFTALFAERNELRDKDCHRQVFESRSPKTMIAMGCSLYQLEIGPLTEGADKRWFRGMYECETGNYPFTAFCFLKQQN